MHRFSLKFSAFIILTALVLVFLSSLPVEAATTQTAQESFLSAKIQLLQAQIGLLKAQISLLFGGVQPSGVNCAQLNILWESVSGVAGYRLYRDGVLVYEGGAASFADSGLALGKKYRYVVRAVYMGKEGQPSEVKEVTAPNVCPPQTPRLSSKAEPCGGNITLSWASSPMATTYQVFRANQEIYKGPLNSFVNSRLGPNSVYEYKIRAGNSGGWSNFSALAVFRASNICPPQAPQALEASPVVLGAGKEGILSVAVSSFSPDNARIRLDTDAETDSPYPTLEAWGRAGTFGSVMAFDVKALLSDITITRVDLFFDSRPWLYLDKVKLSFGYWTSVEKEISQESFTEIETGSVYQLRFDGFSALVEKGRTSTFSVMVDARESTPAVLPKDINIFLENNSIRGIDTAGVSQFAPLSGGGKGGVFSRTFKIEF